MPDKSVWTLPIPEVSLPTYVFGSPSEPASTKLAFADALRPETHFITFSDFRLWSKRLAAGLQRAGLKPGDRVLLFSGNNIFFPIVVMGVIMAGGVFTGANPTYVARELAHQLKDSGAKFLLSADSSLEVALDAASSVGFSKQNVFIFDEGVYDGSSSSRLNVQNWSQLIASKSEGDKFAWKEPANVKETLCCLNYSSGTTGVAKGVMITHYNHVANAVQTEKWTELRENHEEKLKTDTSLCCLPMYHAYGQAAFAVMAPKRNVPVYILSKFDFVKMLECVQRFRITAFTLVPPIAVALAKSPIVKNYDLSSIEAIVCGAAPLSSAVSQEVERLWPAGQINVKQGWGMTETTCSAMGWDPRLHSDSFGVGALNANCEAMVMAEDNVTELGAEETGELWVRGPNIMKGYWRNEKATAETLTKDGWLKTGDVCYRDKKGVYFIVDRRKELIKVKGLQVAPAELEAVLMEHEQVADVGVVGVTINGDESPRAYVVLKEGNSVKEADLVKYMESKVSRHKRLTGGVVFLDAIPKNPSGKILRKELRERAKKEVGDSDVKPARL